jgi:hypothetical protein
VVERAPRAVVVAIRKAGTHLIRNVVTSLGYTPFGDVAAPAGPPQPIGREVAWRAVCAAYPPAEVHALAESGDQAAIGLAVKRAVAAYVEAWWIRLGARSFPPRASGAAGSADADLVARVLASATADSFNNTPQGLCWFLHSLDLDRLDPWFVRCWSESAEPPVIFLYRDPRDVLVSMVNFLGETEPGGLGAFADDHAYAGIMRTATVEERLLIALTDPGFPALDGFERGAWLLRHPHVCAVAFEDLIGPDGGGARARQMRAITRLASHLGATTDPATIEAVAGTVFDRTAHTFRSGRVGGWRECFTPTVNALFDARYGRLTRLYSYR